MNLRKESGVHYSLIDDKMGSKNNVNNKRVQLSIPCVVNSSIIWKFLDQASIDLPKTILSGFS